MTDSNPYLNCSKPQDLPSLIKTGLFPQEPNMQKLTPLMDLNQLSANFEKA